MLSGVKTIKTIKKSSAAAKTAMSNCPKCGKPVYFAERKVILGKDWHSSCLRCDNCDKTLTPGQHSAHQEKPYCNACYQRLFGQEGFRQGVLRTKQLALNSEDEQSAAEKQEIVSKIREYNLYKIKAVEKFKHVEINGRILYEGVIKIYWGLKKAITLAPGVMYAKSRNNRDSVYDFIGVDDAAYIMMLEEAQKVRQRRDLDESERQKLMLMAHGWDSKDMMPREVQGDDLSMSLPASFFSGADGTTSLPGTLERKKGRNRNTSLEMTSEDGFAEVDGNSVSRSLTRGSSVDVYQSPVRKRSASFRRISKQKKAEEKTDKKRHNFTPPYGESTNLRLFNTAQTADVIKMLLAKFKVENEESQFSLCVRYDNGFQDVCRSDDCPLQMRLKLGPSEEIAKLFIVESSEVADSSITAEVGEWIKFSLHELEIFSKKYQEEQERESQKIKERFGRWRQAITDRLGIDVDREETDV